jgi:translocation and assembly module TamB
VSALKVLRWTALCIVGAVLLAVLAGLWILNSQVGTRWAVGVAERLLDEQLTVAGVEGSLAGPLTLQSIRYRDAISGLDVTVERVHADVALLALLRTTVQVEAAEIQGVNVALGTPQPDEPQATTPFSLRPPIDIVVKRFVLNDAVVRRAEQELVAVTSAELIGSWTDAGVAMQRLELFSPQGEVHFAGNVAQTDRYVGKGEGRFRWQVGELQYAGDIEATADERAQVQLKLNSPLDARLTASLEQSDALPWRFELEVPRFDPREELLPDSSLQALAASLRGAGTMTDGEITGNVAVNDVAVRIDPLRFMRNERRITLDPLVVRIGESAGSLQAKGDIMLASQPVQAQLQLNWSELDIPATLAGQQLKTHGALHVGGSPESFAADGEFSIGPANQLVDIALDLQGTPQSIELKELALVQAAGRLAASGKIELQPQIAWRLQSQASNFNPGALAAGWPGQLSFALQSQGRMTDTGPDGTLALENLRGRLRQRSVSGRADLTFTSQPTLAGTLMLSSAGSRIDVEGKRGDTLQATAVIDVQSLADWLPDAAGKLSGRVTAQGRWPQLQLATQLTGTDLRVATASAAALDLNAQVTNPKQPSGSARLEVKEIAAGGLEFSTLRVGANGGMQAHAVQLTATGERLSGAVRVSGSQQDASWSGVIEQLDLDVPKLAQLALQSPARATFSAGAVTLQQTCLTDRDIRICAAFDSKADGELRATYSLAGVQLGLANAFVPTLPVVVSGMIEGEGDIRRTVNGELHGQARIALPGGRISAAETPDETLLEYSQLNVAASLAGANARATLSGRLGSDGRLDGNVALSGLGRVDASIDGRAALVMPNLAPLAVFVPQLTNVAGRAELQASATGRLNEPRITGELRATQLAAQVPDLGLKLANGSVRATPQANGDIDLAGEIQSGQGKLSFDGRMQRSGEMRIAVKGADFLAADIPAAHVIAAPDLQFTRDSTRMALTGQVQVPRAKVDLKKLPRGSGVRSPSPDVVVIDEVTQQEAKANALPLHADVTIILGDAVELSGFGLEAKVGGRLAVKEVPGVPTTGSGEISVAGTYKAYGQDLTIQQGRLMFAGTPLDDPRLNIVAVRKVEEVTAGLRVTGAAKSPQLSVFSEPSMSQAEALSYLVAGRPLDSIGNSEGEGDALQSAARSIGTAGGGLLAKSIGGRLGVDKVGVENNEMIGGSAFTVGEYLSPRLYLSYGVGLFEPGEVVSLRYRLSKLFSVQAARGSKETRAGIEYRIEK